MQSERKRIRKETIKNAVARMGRIAGFTKLQREKMYHEFFTECVRQAAYTLSRYSFCEIYSSNKVVIIQDIIDETNFTTRDDVEPFHVLIAINMIAPIIYQNLIMDYQDPEMIKLPLKLEKKELPPKHFCRPRNRYFCELDDLKKKEMGFYLEMQIPDYHIKENVKTYLKNHPTTIFDFG